MSRQTHYTFNKSSDGLVVKTPHECVLQTQAGRDVVECSAPPILEMWKSWVRILLAASTFLHLRNICTYMIDGSGKPLVVKCPISWICVRS